MPRIALTALTVALLAIPAVGGTAMAAPTCGGLAPTIVGNPWSELLVGTFGPDVIMARGGHDTVLALSGDDVVCAGAGRDIVLGGRGADRIFGENGNDRLFGDSGFDDLDGGDGRDRCRVGRDGGTETNCGTDGGGGGWFDLSVDVTSTPATRVNSEERIEFSVVVRNNGNAPSSPYTLVVRESLDNVDCEVDPSGSTDKSALGAGQTFQRDVTYAAGCVVTGNVAGRVDLTVSVQYAGADTNPSNDSSSDGVVVEPPSQG